MKRLFDNLAPVIVWSSTLLLFAKLSALIIDAFLPPIPTLDCPIEQAKVNIHYPVAEAFGLKSPPKAKPTRKPSRPQKPVTLKGYTLSMTAIGHPSMALILHGKRGKLLSEGDRFGGFTLQKIYTDRVMLTKNGREYWLLMQKKKEFVPLGHVSPIQKNVPQKELEEMIRREDNTYYIPRELIAQMHDLRKIFKYIAIKPIYRNNKIVGFGISRIVKGSVFDKMGLRKRDIIEKVNGQPIKSEADGFKYFNKFNELSSLTLTIRRGRQRKELHYEIF